MPRPSKHVSPDTLGGRIRAARECLRLSLAEVAEGHYSTSLISQIERNRVDPSQESLRFLAERLHLQLEDLEELAQQHRESEVEARQYRSFEDLRTEASRLLAEKDTQEALYLLEGLHFSQIPVLQRWRLAALRGQCYYERHEYVKAQQDFLYATHEQPRQEGMNSEQRHEVMLLHLHLASAYRQLGQLDHALEEYYVTLRMMGRDTPFGYVAEAHWGMALVTYAQAYKMQSASPPEHANDSINFRERKLRTALEHAENARTLYRSIGEPLRAASVTCHIAQIDKELGDTCTTRTLLREVLQAWHPVPPMQATLPPDEQKRVQEQANVVSAAACTLAGMALEAGHCAEALSYVNCALETGERSYKLRQADAHIMHGRILEAIDLHDDAAEDAFRRAVTVLAGTDRLSARISAQMRLARHLLKKGNIDEGEQALDEARALSDQVSASSATTEDAVLMAM